MMFYTTQQENSFERNLLRMMNATNLHQPIPVPQKWLPIQSHIPLMQLNNQIFLGPTKMMTSSERNMAQFGRHDTNSRYHQANRKRHPNSENQWWSNRCSTTARELNNSSISIPLRSIQPVKNQSIDMKTEKSFLSLSQALPATSMRHSIENSSKCSNFVPSQSVSSSPNSSSSTSSSSSGEQKKVTDFSIDTLLNYHSPDCSHKNSSRDAMPLIKNGEHFVNSDNNVNSSSKSFLSIKEDIPPKILHNCPDCQRTYSTSGALKMHVRTHTLPCRCDVCGKSFSRPWLLQGHMRTHSGEKPFKCLECGRAFADKSNLRAHLQTHSKIKRYKCTNCDKSFSRLPLLTRHRFNCSLI